jgi:hypothetical protein
MKYSEYLNEMRRPSTPKLKELNIPLTDSEIKKLEALQKKMKKGARRFRGEELRFGLDALKGTEQELLGNLEIRAKVPQKEFELKTMAQIKKSKSLTSTLKAFLYLSQDSVYKKNYLKYADKSEKLKKENFDLFTSEYRLKAEKIVKSKAFKDLAIQALKADVEENNYNTQIPASVRDWAISLIIKEGIDWIVRYDGYKLYQDLESEEFEEGWTSYQGASMTTKKAKAIFTGVEGKHEMEFNLGTSGYWN